MSDPYIGEIRLMPYTYAPYGWARCDGESLPVAQYNALYAVIGNMYGGDTNNFNVPDMRGRVSIAMGTGVNPPLTPRSITTKGGNNSVALTNIPLHDHPVATGATATGSNTTLSGNLFTTGGRGTLIYTPADTTTQVALNAITVSASGQATPDAHENRQPFQVIQYCIALEGVFPVKP